MQKTTKTNFTIVYFIVLAIVLIVGAYFIGMSHGVFNGYMIGNIHSNNSSVEELCVDFIGKDYNASYVNDVCLFEINSSQPNIYILDCGIIKIGLTEKASLIQQLQLYVYTKCRVTDKVDINEYI